MKDYLFGAAIWLIVLAATAVGIECCGDEVEPDIIVESNGQKVRLTPTDNPGRFSFSTKPVSDLPDILLPMTPILVEPVDEVPIPTPTPKPQAEVITNLPSDTWFVFESKEQLLVTSSPLGLVQVKQYDVSKISRSFIGKFVDGNGSSDEERTYPTSEDYKWIYSVKAKKSGTVELILYKQGVTTEEGLVRQTLTVMGHAPKPPPIPEPEPDVIVPPTPAPTGLRVMFLYEETAPLTALNAINSTELTQWLTDNCAKDPDGRPGFRRWDRSTILSTGVAAETEVWRKLWEAVKTKGSKDNTVYVITDTSVSEFPITNLKDILSSLTKIKEGK